MTLAACYVAHNDAPQLRDSMLSVKAYVDRYVIVDVAFEGNTAGHLATLHSIDHTKRVAHEAAGDVPLTYIEPDERMPEHEARNLYLDALAPGDWALILDADERLLGDYELVRQLVEGLAWVQSSAFALRVYTTAVLAPMLAPQIDRARYATGPRIATSGYMPRLVRARPELRHVRRQLTETVATYGGLDDELGPIAAVELPEPIILNDHAGGAWEHYQHDYRWQVAQGGIT